MTAYAMTAHWGAYMLATHGGAGHWLSGRWHAPAAFIGLSLALDRLAPGWILQKLRYMLFRISERFYEWRFGIVSDAEILIDALGITDAACHDYLATGYLRFRQVMKLIAIRDGRDVFLDFGSGMGRAVVLAATYPFDKVIGVEIAPSLHALATENVRRALKKLRCRDIELHNVDARAFAIPPEVTVIYMWNPFAGDILNAVLANIQRSLAESPRALTILHLSPENPTNLDVIADRFPWLNEFKRVRLGAHSLAVIYTCGAVAALAV